MSSYLKILLAHLLKLRVQYDIPDSMKGTWYSSILEHRQRVINNLANTPSLKSFLIEAVEKAYPDARKLVVRQGNLAGKRV
ncbi:MAG: DUF29 domain-containing protein [Nostoc sp.]|uniref:DUF29 domain-containing protein n=1 Tax=Nostoc sp. TaxID=1180 RepID=UPI002FF7DC0C